MATKIVTKNSSTAGSAPSASDLVQGELAVNVVDKRLYTEDNAGNIVELGTNPLGEITANGGIALGDNDKATFGASDDLQIYHNGSQSFITDTGTGDLFIRASNTYIQSAGNENGLRVLSDGAVEAYYDNAIKLATTATGIDVTGTATMDGLSVQSTATTRPTIGNSDVNTNGLTTGLNFEPISNLTNGAKLNVINGLQPTVASAYTAGFEFVTEDHSGGGTFAQTKALTIGASGDISFYEDTGTTAKLFWDASAESLGIGGGTVYGKLRLNDSSGACQIYMTSENASDCAIIFGAQDDLATASLGYFHSDDSLRFNGYNNTTRMTIDSLGNASFNTTNTAPAYNNVFGTALLQYGGASMSRTNSTTLDLNRSSSDGAIIGFRKNGDPVGSIGTSGGDLNIGTTNCGLLFNDGTPIIIPSNVSTNTVADASIDLGYSAGRFKDIYAVNGTIQTSDAREKTAVRELTDAEMRVAKKLSKNIGFFQWLSAVEKKGADARSHCGQTVQGVIAEFDAEGLDAFDYAMVCYNEWEDEFTEHPAIEAVEAVEAVEGVEAVEAVEAVDAVLDEDGEIVSEAVEAVEAVEGVDAVEAVEAVEAVDAWTEQTQEQGDRFSLRTDQLNHFMIRGLAQSQEELEARLSALEE